MTRFPAFLPFSTRLRVASVMVLTLLCGRAQTATVLYNGWGSGFVSGNSTVFAAGEARPGTAGVGPYCRFVDADAGVAGVQVFFYAAFAATGAANTDDLFRIHDNANPVLLDGDWTCAPEA